MDIYGRACVMSQGSRTMIVLTDSRCTDVPQGRGQWFQGLPPPFYLGHNWDFPGREATGMSGKRRAMDVDPNELDRAATRMRAMAVRDYHASDDLQRGLTERAGADHIFGNSPAASDILAKWDRVITALAQHADVLGTRTQDMAENLERAADTYRRNEEQSAEQIWLI
ncbi:hypothetical protein ABIA39_007230 [Nocardia sp. GAS34]|uniref:hypothetical protein n=1 Tax=unclassified Nocardia TaxID=2637762 RepID=UPI003D192415